MLLNNNNKNLKLTNINKKKLAILKWIFQKKLLNNLFQTFKKITFSKFEFLADNLVFHIR